MILLTLLFVLSLVPAALAEGEADESLPPDDDGVSGSEDLTPADGNASVEIAIPGEVTLLDAGEADPVYFVTVEWSVTPGSCEIADVSAWNPQELVYETMTIYEKPPTRSSPSP